jgi:hypothetical protein
VSLTLDCVTFTEPIACLPGLHELVLDTCRNVHFALALVHADLSALELFQCKGDLLAVYQAARGVTRLSLNEVGDEAALCVVDMQSLRFLELGLTRRLSLESFCRMLALPGLRRLEIWGRSLVTGGFFQSRVKSDVDELILHLRLGNSKNRHGDVAAFVYANFPKLRTLRLDIYEKLTASEQQLFARPGLTIELS